MRPRRHFAIAAIQLASAAIIACGGSSNTEESGGEVLSDSTYRGLDYVVTSDQYRQWLRAQAALDTVDVGTPVRIDVRRASEADIERVVTALDGRPAARQAIEQSGMKVRDFVLTTVALAQSWDAVNQPERGLIDVPRANIELMSREPTNARPRARVIDDSDSDSDSDSRKKVKEKKGRGSDSDS